MRFGNDGAGLPRLAQPTAGLFALPFTDRIGDMPSICWTAGRDATTISPLAPTSGVAPPDSPGRLHSRGIQAMCGPSAPKESCMNGKIGLEEHFAIPQTLQ